MTAPTAVDALRDRLGRVEDDDRKASDHLDRVALVGSASAILASIGFLKDIAPHPSNVSLSILLLAWICYLGSGALALASQQSTKKAAKAFAARLRIAIDENRSALTEEDYAGARVFNDKTVASNRRSLALFGAGTLLLLVFAAINLPFAKTHDSAIQSAPALPTGTLEGCKLAGCTIRFAYTIDFSSRISPAHDTIPVSPQSARRPSATQPKNRAHPSRCHCQDTTMTTPAPAVTPPIDPDREPKRGYEYDFPPRPKDPPPPAQTPKDK